MKPLSSHSYLEAAALITIPVVGAFAIWLAWPLRSAIQQSSKGSTAILAKVGIALDAINRPKSGTLSMVDDTILQGRLTIDATNKVLLHEQTQLGTIDGYARNLNAEVSGLTTHVDTTLDALSGSASAATQTLSQATATVKQVGDKTTLTLGTADSAIQAAQPLLGRATLFVGHADDDVVEFKPVLVNSQEITAQGAIITKDAKVEEQKYVYPPKTPWYKKIVPTTLKVGELAYDFIR